MDRKLASTTSTTHRLNNIGPNIDFNITKWSNTLKQFVDNLPTNCLSVSDHFVILKSILEPILFNPCVGYMSQMTPESECLQYADDTTLYRACKASDNMHLSAVLRKISTLFRDGQVIQTLFLKLPKQKLWS